MSTTLPYGHSSSDTGVDLNSAPVSELCTVPGIGPTLAQHIVTYRDEHGPFSDPSELVRVPRIGARMAARLSERILVAGRDSSPDSLAAIPLALGALASPPPANVTIEEALPPSIETQPAPPHAEADVVAVIEKRHRRGLAVVCLMASMTGLFGGYCLTVATAKPVEPAQPSVTLAQTAANETAHQEIRTELERQAADLSSTNAAVAKVAERQAALEEQTHVEQARVSREVADLAERTKRAQAKTDAKVYQLGEAMKLIDWAATGGYATKASTQVP